MFDKSIFRLSIYFVLMGAKGRMIWSCTEACHGDGDLRSLIILFIVAWEGLQFRA